MYVRLTPLLLIALIAPASLFAQEGAADITGTWRTETPEGPREVIVRPDSSASVGEETVRWRLSGDSVLLAFGDEWVAYNYELSERRLTLSGGDLEEPLSLTHIGPPTPRPEGVPVPPAPPADRRATP